MPVSMGRSIDTVAVQVLISAQKSPGGKQSTVVVRLLAGIEGGKGSVDGLPARSPVLLCLLPGPKLLQSHDVASFIA